MTVIMYKDVPNYEDHCLHKFTVVYIKVLLSLCERVRYVQAKSSHGKAKTNGKSFSVTRSLQEGERETGRRGGVNGSDGEKGNRKVEKVERKGERECNTG